LQKLNTNIGSQGLGRGLPEAYASKPNTNVIAGVREVAKSGKDLSSVKLGAGSKVIKMKLDSTSKSDAKAAVEELKAKYGIK
jgi:NAD(P)-dependent dehydrogenase (short-subunit alcohol dehydrogenase family)